MADRFPTTAGESKEHSISNMALQTISRTLSIVSGGDEIAGAVATELQSIFVVPTNDSQPTSQVGSISQGGNDGDSRINIEQASENVTTHAVAMPLIIRAILLVGLLTLVAVGRTMLSKPASGLVLVHNKIPYYVSVVVIFSFGVAELFIGTWISMSRLTHMRRLWIGGSVLFLSIWPLIGILSIGGSA